MSHGYTTITIMEPVVRTNTMAILIADPDCNTIKDASSRHTRWSGNEVGGYRLETLGSYDISASFI